MSDFSLKKEFEIRLYGSLNDFLPEKYRQRTFLIAFKTPITVAEVIESLGIPGTEVKLILINSEEVKPSAQLNGNDRLTLYPAFETISFKDSNVSGNQYPRFILDAHLGKLSKYLRMLGFDTLYRNDFEDQAIINISKEEQRIILSRDKLLLGSKDIFDGYYVRATEKHEQLREVVRKFDLNKKFRSFSRCMTCNNELIPKSREEIQHLIDKEIVKIYSKYFYCSNCHKVFWRGSHFERMEKMIISLL